MRTLNLIAIGFLCATTLMAQEPPAFERGEERHGRGMRGEGMRSEALNSYLNLTEPQVADLKTARQASREESRPIMQALREKSRALREEMRMESPNPGVIGDLTVEVKDLRDQLKATRTAQRDQLLVLLTEEQRGQVEELERVMSLQAAAHQAAALNFIEGPGMRRGFGGRGGKGRPGSGPRGRMHGPGPEAPPEGAAPILLD